MIRCFAAFLLCASPLWAQKYPIIDLRAIGSERYKPQQIIATTGLKKDIHAEIPLTQVRDAAQKLANLGVFKEVNYRHTALTGGMRVEFTVKDNDEEQFVPTTFENFVWFKSKEIDTELRKRVPLYDGEVSLSGNIRDELATELREMLAAVGVKAHVSAEPNTKEGGPPDEIVFRVEDVEITVSKVELTGASGEFSALLQKPLEKLVGLPYQLSTIKNYADNNLRRIYLAKGYLRAAFGEPMATVLSNEPGVTRVGVAIPITEGRQYTFSKVRWTGNAALAESELQRQLHLVSGAAVNGAVVEDDTRAIRSEYARHGYMQMMLTPKPIFNDGTGTVEYEMVINEGPLFRMGELDITGIDQKAAEKLRAEWKLRAGEPFDIEYLRRFAGMLDLPSGAGYIVEQSEGEAPNIIDLTFLFCKAGDPCKPSPSTLYSSPKQSPKKEQP